MKMAWALRLKIKSRLRCCSEWYRLPPGRPHATLLQSWRRKQDVFLHGTDGRKNSGYQSTANTCKKRLILLLNCFEFLCILIRVMPKRRPLHVGRLPVVVMATQFPLARHPLSRFCRTPKVRIVSSFLRPLAVPFALWPLQLFHHHGLELGWVSQRL